MLQGSLENFALDEVLGLLASTGKTGRLGLTGDRGNGELLICEGRLVDAESTALPTGTDPEEIIFELLRFEAGSFTFDIGPVDPSLTSRDISEVLAVAESRLADWRSIEAVVPSVDHVIRPVTDLPVDEITISRQEWAVLRLVAGGSSVSSVCHVLGLGEVDGSREIKRLADRGLVTIEAPGVVATIIPPSSSPAPSSTPSPSPAAAASMAPASTAPAADSEAYDLPATPPSLRPPEPEAVSMIGGEDRQIADEYAPMDAGLARSRPPRPPAPSADELVDHFASPESHYGNGGSPFDSFDTPAAYEPERVEEPQPSGLLMRYLKKED